MGVSSRGTDVRRICCPRRFRATGDRRLNEGLRGPGLVSPVCVTRIVFMKTDWVSVKDRLPGNDCRALVTDGRHVTVADWTRGEGWSLDRDDRNVGITSDVLTHWMPLPEPPVQPVSAEVIAKTSTRP